MAKLPKAIEVGPFGFKVSTDRLEISEAGHESGDGRLYGSFDMRGARIILDGTVNSTLQRDTLLHECLHAVFEVSGANVGIDQEAEEKLVSQLSPALLDLLRRNPRAVKFWTA